MPSLLDAPGGLLGLGDPPPPAAQPDLTDALARLLRNPVGTETTQSVGQQTPIDPIAYMGRDGTPIMNSDLARAHQELQQAYQTAPTMALGMMGSTEPGFRAFHGSPYNFDRFDISKVHPDEAGHYFASDEAMARDYAGRSGRDPTAGHMYEVNVKADPSQFLDYGSLSGPQQAALNDPGAVQRLRDAGIPGITLPDKTHVVFNDNTIEILRKYGIAGLIAGSGVTAATQRPQQ